MGLVPDRVPNNTTDAYNTYKQFPIATKCSGFYGPVYCNTTLSPAPPIP